MRSQLQHRRGTDARHRPVEHCSCGAAEAVLSGGPGPFTQGLHPRGALTHLGTNAEGGLCVGIKVKGLQDTVSFAVGTVGEDISMGAPHTHLPAQQHLKGPGQSLATYSCDVSTVWRTERASQEQRSRRSKVVGCLCRHLEAKRPHCN